MARVKFKDVNKIFQEKAKLEKKFYEFWKPSTEERDVHVVKDINMDIKDGEFLVLVGPSGCGKSTTLRMLAGLEEVSSGEIYIEDKMVNDLTPKDRDIAMVFQNYALYPHMNVYENMAFGLRLRKTPSEEIETRVKDTAELLGIEKLLERKPKELSGGQRQRVAMGRAIVRKPKVFLMDEPLSNLDAKLRVQMRAELQKLHHRMGITTIYVTHDQTEAMTLGERIALLSDGVIQQLDTPLNIYNNPVNKFVAGFIGSPAMNFIEGRIVEEDGALYFQASSFKFRLPGGKLKEHIGKEVILGIRPENVYDKKFAKTEPEEGDVFKARVDVTEPLGSEVILYLTIGGDSLVARVDPQTSARVGDTLEILFDREMIHVFDGQTGKNFIAKQ